MVCIFGLTVDSHYCSRASTTLPSWKYIPCGLMGMLDNGVTGDFGLLATQASVSDTDASAEKPKNQKKREWLKVRDVAVAVAERIRAFEVREVVGQAGMDRDAGAAEEWGRMDVGDVQRGAGAEGCRH